MYSFYYFIFNDCLPAYNLSYLPTKFLLSNLRVHNGLQFVVELPAMSTLQVIVVRLVVLAFPWFHVIFIVSVPSGIFHDVLVDRVHRRMMTIFLQRFNLIVSQL